MPHEKMHDRDLLAIVTAIILSGPHNPPLLVTDIPPAVLVAHEILKESAAKVHAE